MPSRHGLIPESIKSSQSIVGIAALSSLGHDLEAHFTAISEGGTGVGRMSELFGNDSRHAALPGAWIEPRELLTHRKWSPATMAALHVAKAAVAMAGWSAAEMEGAALILGTSRGNAAGWLDPWPGRRPFKLMAASNTIHSEPATAISIELGILGPNHVLASGCSAGLDALGLGKMFLDAGAVERVLVVAVDLPLVPKLLDNYVASGLLATSERLNPFADSSNGFIPGEGAAAIALSSVQDSKLKFSHFANNSDGADPVGVPKDGGRSHLILREAVRQCGMPSGICPHSTGTRIQARAEKTFLGDMFAEKGPSLHLLKPYVGHTVGCSGLLESAILLRYMADSQLPPNIPGTVGIAGIAGIAGMEAPSSPRPCMGPVFKLAHGMGGHNALAVFQTTT